jgi:hypothetical protein
MTPPPHPPPTPGDPRDPRLRRGEDLPRRPPLCRQHPPHRRDDLGARRRHGDARRAVGVARLRLRGLCVVARVAHCTSWFLGRGIRRADDSSCPPASAGCNLTDAPTPTRPSAPPPQPAKGGRDPLHAAQRRRARGGRRVVPLRLDRRRLRQGAGGGGMVFWGGVGMVTWLHDGVSGVDRVGQRLGRSHCTPPSSTANATTNQYPHPRAGVAQAAEDQGQGGHRAQGRRGHGGAGLQGGGGAAAARARVCAAACGCA